MKINIDALKALELKLAEYGKANGAVAKYQSSIYVCPGTCTGTCNTTCYHSCKTGRK